MRRAVSRVRAIEANAGEVQIGWRTVERVDEAAEGGTRSVETDVSFRIYLDDHTATEVLARAETYSSLAGHVRCEPDEPRC